MRPWLSCATSIAHSGGERLVAPPHAVGVYRQKKEAARGGSLGVVSSAAAPRRACALSLGVSSLSDDRSAAFGRAHRGAISLEIRRECYAAGWPQFVCRAMRTRHRRVINFTG